MTHVRQKFRNLRSAHPLSYSIRRSMRDIAKLSVFRPIVNLLLKRFGHLRVSRRATSILGLQYRRAKRIIELDITYTCNLTCSNCNRSCGQAPTGNHMTIEQIERFIQESISKNIKWRRINLLGGEPTLHPDFSKILDALVAYRDAYSPRTRIGVATNGCGKKVEISDRSHTCDRRRNFSNSQKRLRCDS